MKRKHLMPFGAEVLNEYEGGVRFRLWAPKPKQIDVLIDETLWPMQPTDAGWFELIAPRASAGSRYQFVIDRELRVPDPASRFQPEDVHKPSEVIDPSSFDWTDENWRGRPWEEAVIYELHVGAFTPGGTFASLKERLDYLHDLGITAIELMPVADFAGKRNWGYDGVLPFAPDSSYGRPDELKHFIQSAHAKNLMVLLDVVYNHFGPEGSYLNVYAPEFFTARHHTPWGDAINFDGERSRTVRKFFIHNALYWLEEFHFDGLRFDAVHAIKDDSSPNILEELAASVRRTFPDRHIHLVLENDDNSARYLARGEFGKATLFTAQWNDDIHHASHVLVSNEVDGYYEDYATAPLQALGKCLTEGFSFQGQPSQHRGGKRRGEKSSDLPLTSFVSFLQNHDQVGNRAFGDRILCYGNDSAVRAIMSILLLAPSPPMLFMGEEFAASTPFLFFCDFHGDLARAVTDGRRAEFAKFAQFRDPEIRGRIPDPNAESTFRASKLDWESLDELPHKEYSDFYCQLLNLRQKTVVPLLYGSTRPAVSFAVFESTGLRVCWQFEGRSLRCVSNLGENTIAAELPRSIPFHATHDHGSSAELPPWSVFWYLNHE